MIFAQGVSEFAFSETILGILRIVASVAGALVGWFVCDPLTRLVYRLSYRKATPGWLLPWTKLAGAITAAVLIYVFLPLGGGGGFGFGFGGGGGLGKGPGKNGNPSTLNGTTNKSTTEPVVTTKADPQVKSVEIVIVSLKKFVDDGTERFYLLNHQEPPLSIKELRDYFEQQRGKLEVTPVLTKESIGVGQDNNPLNRLRKLTKEMKITTHEIKHQ
jgi:hypothetical protein